MQNALNLRGRCHFEERVESAFKIGTLVESQESGLIDNREIDKWYRTSTDSESDTERAG